MEDNAEKKRKHDGNEDNKDGNKKRKKFWHKPNSNKDPSFLSKKKGFLVTCNRGRERQTGLDLIKTLNKVSFIKLQETNRSKGISTK